MEPLGEDILDSNPGPDVHSAVSLSLAGLTRVTGTTPTADGTTLYKNVLIARGLSDLVALEARMSQGFMMWIENICLPMRKRRRSKNGANDAVESIFAPYCPIELIHILSVMFSHFLKLLGILALGAT